MIQRTRTHNLIEHSQIGFREFAGTVALSAVPQGSLPSFAEAFGYPVNRSVMDIQNGLDLPCAASVPEIEHNQVPNAHRSDAALLKPFAHLLLDGPTHLRNNSRHGNSSLG